MKEKTEIIIVDKFINSFGSNFLLFLPFNLDNNFLLFK